MKTNALAKGSCRCDNLRNRRIAIKKEREKKLIADPTNRYTVTLFSSENIPLALIWKSSGAHKWNSCELREGYSDALIAFPRTACARVLPHIIVYVRRTDKRSHSVVVVADRFRCFGIYDARTRSLACARAGKFFARVARESRGKFQFRFSLASISRTSRYAPLPNESICRDADRSFFSMLGLRGSVFVSREDIIINIQSG